MRERLLPALLMVFLVGISWISTLNLAFSTPVSPETGNYDSKFTFTVQNGFYKSDHTLYVSMPPSLELYYSEKSHSMNGEKDYSKFVTPNAVKSIADNIRNLTQNTPYADEEFVNAVLMIVREITYVKSDAKYPLETIADNQADCDGLSILAASILKAGGLDVVLLLYRGINPTHMNIGVNIEHTPVSHSWWMTPTGVEYDNKTYWIAECTSLADWTVGDRPDLLAGDKPDVIPLVNCEKQSPACISSSLDNRMQLSSVSINLSTGNSSVTGNERAINISGSVSPAFPNGTVTFYVNQPGYAPTPSVVVTDEFGNYTLLWNVSLPGTYIVKASWSGCFNYSGSDSESLTVFIDSQQQPILLQPNSFGDGGFIGIPSQTHSPSYTAMFNQAGKEFLKSNLAATEIVLSGDFMVLSDGHEITPNETTYTIPAFQRTYRVPGSRRTFTTQVPERTVTIPGAELLNSQFGFILSHDGADNYTASVKLLTNNDMSQITQSLDENKALFVNASDVAMKNVWYKALAKVSSDKVVVEVYDENGKLLNMKESVDLNESGVFMTYPVGQVLAFKNLKVEAASQRQSSVPVSSEKSLGTGFDFLFPYVRISLMLAGVGLAAVCLRDRRIRNRHSRDVQESVKQ